MKNESITGFTEVWKDTGSGANDAVTVSYLNPYFGYTCIGDISESPKKTLAHINVFKEYACIKMEYGIQIKLKSENKLWDDSGSGAEKEVSFWRIEHADAVPTKTFVSHPSRGEFSKNNKFYYLNNKFNFVCNYDKWSDQTGCTK